MGGECKFFKVIKQLVSFVRQPRKSPIYIQYNNIFAYKLINSYGVIEHLYFSESSTKVKYMLTPNLVGTWCSHLYDM